MSCGQDPNFVDHISRFIGEVVTVYTTSGGDSGEGFTGVLLAANRNFIRLLTRIGPAPACALGSCCDRDRDRDDRGRDRDDRGRINCRFSNTGSVVDIPVDRIASFVHNTL
ncbi:hypothetical protein GCM10008905_07580 [Clostridium malenominatum]|uniref:Uncharacterized protein n=1 Tax=Clostridium malenominatum TaxID=1539 RepID=A0ABP3TWR9_9CLOT